MLRNSDNITFFGNITLANTGRIQGIDTVSSGTDAANKTYVDNAVAGSGSGSVTSVNFKTDGTALNVASNSITGAGTMTGIWQGTSSEYVNGLGDRVSFPSIPQGDITGVGAGSGLTGGGNGPGSVTLNVGAGNLIDVTADAVNVDLSELTGATGDMISTDSFVITRANGAQFKQVPGLIPNDLFPNDAGYITSASLPTVSNATILITTNTGLDGGTSFTLNGGAVNVRTYL